MLKFNKETNSNEQYDETTGKWFNEKTQKWVKRLRKTEKGQLKGQNVSLIEQKNYTIYKFTENNNPVIFSSDIVENERIELALTKLIRKFYSSVRIQEEDMIDYTNTELTVAQQIETLKTSTFILMRADDLKSWLGNGYKAIMDMLTKEGYVSRKKKSYIVDKGMKVSSMIYKPTKKLFSYKYSMSPVVYTKVFKTVKNKYEKKVMMFDSLDKSYMLNFKSSSNFKFDIDYSIFVEVVTKNYSKYLKEKEEVIEIEYNEKIEKIEKMLKSNMKYKKSGKDTKSYAKYQKAQQTYDNLINKRPLTLEELLADYDQYYRAMNDWDTSNYWDKLDYFRVDTFSGRVHSIFSRVPSIFVDYKWNNQVDGTCFQMTCLGQYLHTNIGKNTFTDKVNNVSDIYDDLRGDVSRVSFKTKMIASVFGSVKGNNHKSYCSLFPDTEEFISNLKTDYSYRKVDGQPCDKVHSSLCCELQQLELRIFKQLWCKLAAKGIPFISKHDSVIVKNGRNLRVAREELIKILDIELKDVKYSIH